MSWKLDELMDHSIRVAAYINGRYVPARPVWLSGIYGWRARIHDAWLVLTGKADAFIWPEGQ